MECGGHFLSLNASSCGIPKGQWGDSIGMDMLRAFLKLGKWGNGIPGLGITGIIYLNQNRTIPLHDQGVVWVIIHELVFLDTCFPTRAVRLESFGRES